MSEQNFNQSMKPFCGNSNATGLFMEANFPAGNYTTPLNTDKEPELLIGSTIESIMLAKNYNSSVKDSRMGDDDIHNEYVDFIVRTALFHREIDNPTTLGSNLAGLKESFSQATEDLLSQSLKDMAPQVNPALKAFMKGVSMRDTFLDFINEVIISKTVKGEDVKQAIVWLVGDCNSSSGALNVRGSLGNLCMATWYTGSGTSSASNNIAKIFAANSSSATTSTILNVSTVLRDVLTSHAVRLNSVLNLVAKPDVTDVRILQGLTNDAHRLDSQLKGEIVDAVYDALRKTLNSVASGNFTTVEQNHHARILFDDVFMNWANLNPHAREFYRWHLHIFRKVGNSIGVSSAEAGWDDIDVDDVNFVRDVKNLNKNEVRINLMKVRKGSENVLFGKTLPFVPVSRISKLWYTDGNGLVKNVTGFDINVVRNIYDCVYMGIPCMVGSQQLLLPTVYSRVATKTADFNVDDALLVRNLIKSRRTEPSKIVSSNSNPVVANLFVQDMLTNVVYHRSDQGLYRIQNGQKIPYADDNIRADNCAGTALRGPQEKCTRFVRDCIVNGDKNELSKCLAYLTDTNANMFEVAHSELVKVDPNMAVQILRTFDVKQIRRRHPVIGEYGEPQSFDSWRETVLPTLKPEVRDAISANGKLCDYIKGVISFVTSNPAILNKNWKGEQSSTVREQPIDDPYIKALGARMWVNPVPNSSDAKLFENQMLVRGFNAPMMAVASPSNITNPFSNVMQSRGSMIAPFGMMRGGANSYENSLINKINANGSIADTVEAMMTNVHDDLAKSKLALTKDNHITLENAFNDVKVIENRMSDLYIMLRTLTDVTSLLKASGCLPADYTVSVSLENLKNRREVLTYLAQHIGDVQNCISNNMNEQNSKCSELVRYYSALVDTANGKQNSDIIQVTDI
jgi:hypothetical protein